MIGAIVNGDFEMETAAILVLKPVSSLSAASISKVLAMTLIGKRGAAGGRAGNSVERDTKRLTVEIIRPAVQAGSSQCF